MDVRYWGVRGSRPTPGPDTARYGGNTTCLSLDLDEGCTLVLDAGTGIANLGRSRPRGPHTYLLLLTHPHWDHIQGFPFFAPRTDPDVTIRILCPDHPEWGELLLGQLDGVRFPVRADAIDARVDILSTGVDAVLAHHGVELEWIDALHPGSCHGYRIRRNGRSVVFLPDNELSAPGTTAVTRAAFAAFARDADVLIHDAQYDAAEAAEHAGWGHSAFSDACDLASDAGVSRLVLFHHDPGRDDLGVDRLLEKARERASRRGEPTNIAAAIEEISTSAKLV